MTQLTKPIRDLHAEAERVAHRTASRARPAIELAARAGYVANGFVYLLVGGLALLAAAGSPQTANGTRGALRSVLDHQYGQFILAAIAAGLVGYALWCFVRALLDPDREGRTARGIARRAVQFGKGLVYVALVVAVVGMIRGTGPAGDGDERRIRDWTATLMSFPLGIWLVGITGVCVIIFGLRQPYRALSMDMDEPLDLRRMSATAHRWTVRFTRVGMAARGVVFSIVGIFLVIAAKTENPAAARGVGGALRALRHRPYGDKLLAVVAVGLIAYGMFMFLLARYRRIRHA
jgi:hypothetical protein